MLLFGLRVNEIAMDGTTNRIFITGGLKSGLHISSKSK
jgi:hypothetical protein